MNSLGKILTALGLLALMLTSCHSPERVPENEEEEIYLLVGEPCSEGDYPKAIARADSLLASPREMSDSLKAFIMIDRNVSICEYGNLDWGIANTDTLIDFGRKTGIELAVMQGLQNRGICRRRKGDLSGAIADYKEGLDIAVKSGDEEMEQVFSEVLAIACGENGLTEEGASFANRSLELSRKADDEIGELNSVSTLAAILVKEGKFKEAISELAPYHDRSRGFKTLMRVKYLTPLLRSYLSLDSLAKVKETLAETYEALEGTPRNTQVYLVAVNTEAALAEKEGRYADQWHWLQVADSIGANGTSPDLWNIGRAQCLANLGRWQQAYEMECAAYEALDSIRRNGESRELSELMVKYDTLSKENAIERLKSARLMWALIALGAVVVVVLVAVAAVSARKRARRRLERERQEEYLRGLEQERSRVARELHDDIAGSLVGLQWQLRGPAPEKAGDTLIDVAKRVRRMSHEMMPPEFGDMNFSSILMDYVARINASDASHHIVLTDEGSYPWDSLSPSESHELYRIVQEAVGNARKHGAEGDIRLILDGDASRFSLKVVNPMRPDSSVPAGDMADGVGIRSLRMRAALLDASLDVKADGGYFVLYVFQ